MSAFGYTCEKCPHRGHRGAEDDWVSYTALKDKKAGYRRSLNLSWPIRCSACNNKYAAFKRAREAGMRLEVVRRSIASGKNKNRFRYLKFVTCTWKHEWTTNPEPDMTGFKEMWKTARSVLVEKMEVQGGTDVIETKVTEKDVDGVTMYRHHIHTHSLWCAPYVPLVELQAAMTEAGIGRHEYTVLQEDEYDSGHTKQAVWVAIDYLAKYLTKCQGTKRQVFGELRKWKEHMHPSKCRVCVKTTSQMEKEDHCECSQFET